MILPCPQINVVVNTTIPIIANDISQKPKYLQYFTPQNVIIIAINILMPIMAEEDEGKIHFRNTPSKIIRKKNKKIKNLSFLSFLYVEYII